MVPSRRGPTHQEVLTDRHWHVPIGPPALTPVPNAGDTGHGTGHGVADMAPGGHREVTESRMARLCGAIRAGWTRRDAGVTFGWGRRES